MQDATLLISPTVHQPYVGLKHTESHCRFGKWQTTLILLKVKYVVNYINYKGNMISSRFYFLSCYSCLLS